ncbi:MAG: HAMP domain-containing sensor histidine kinase [Pseudohongiellaceae bacterium]
MSNPVDMHTIMAATVHDVKNALSLIDNELREVIDSIHEREPESTMKLNRLRLEAGRINNDLVHMLGLYRMNTDTFRPDFDEVLIEDVIHDATSRYQQTLASLGVHLGIELEDPDIAWVIDPVLIEGVLANILTNSIRYTNDRLDFRVFMADGGLCITLTDNGEGYPSNMMNFMSETPNQGELSFQNGSTGLGLYFCQQIAQLHRQGEAEGYIKLTNHPDHGGAVFTLWLP